MVALNKKQNKIIEIFCKYYGGLVWDSLVWDSSMRITESHLYSAKVNYAVTDIVITDIAEYSCFKSSVNAAASVCIWFCPKLPRTPTSMISCARQVRLLQLNSCSRITSLLWADVKLLFLLHWGTPAFSSPGSISCYPKKEPAVSQDSQKGKNKQKKPVCCHQSCKISQHLC